MWFVAWSRQGHRRRSFPHVFSFSTHTSSGKLPRSFPSSGSSPNSLFLLGQMAATHARLRAASAHQSARSKKGAVVRRVFSEQVAEEVTICGTTPPSHSPTHPPSEPNIRRHEHYHRRALHLIEPTILCPTVHPLGK